MKKQKIHSTTQDFTEIVDISDDIVIFKNNNACGVIEVSSVNFDLLSKEEQDARIYSYMSLLNSLTFAIQILIISKKIDLTAYLNLIDQKVLTSTNQKVVEHLKKYREFIQDLIKKEELLDKKVYVVIPFSSLELGPVAATKGLKMDLKQKSRETVHNKANLIITELQRMGLYSKQLKNEELIKVFYEIFNQDILPLDFEQNSIKNIIL